MEKPVSSIGLMPLLLKNAHTTALLNHIKEAVEHLNPKFDSHADDGPARSP